MLEYNINKIHPEADIIPASQHHLNSRRINKHAFAIIQRLKNAGFEAYVVGGGVRDLLLDQKPKDFDVVTNARPRQVRRLFNNCRVIGKRFRLAHIYYGTEIIEVATFRASHEGAEPHQAKQHVSGLILRDNVFGTLEEDATRRDFTINALYYDPVENKLLDFFNGFDDIQKRILRIIGNPQERYREDPMRMLRATRFAGKLDLVIDKKTEKSIMELAHLLSQVSPSRLYDEMIKLIYSGKTAPIFKLIQKFHLWEALFFGTDFIIKQNPIYQDYFTRFFEATDNRIKKNKPVSVIFFFATLLWPEFEKQYHHSEYKEFNTILAYYTAAKTTLHQQSKILALPKNCKLGIQDIWTLQSRLEKRKPRTIRKLLHSKRFRAAYDLVGFHGILNKALIHIWDWWTKIQHGDEVSQQRMIKALSSGLHSKNTAN